MTGFHLFLLILFIGFTKVSPDIVIALAGNKVDMNINRKVSLTEAEKYGSDNNLIFMETSSVTGQNVKLTFKALGEIARIL